MLAPLLFLLAPLLLAAAACAGAPVRQGKDAPEAVVETRVRSVALFKNGLGFVRREGPLPGKPGPIRLERLPVPVHGTFWVAADPARAALGPCLARRDEIEERVPALNLEEILRANLGREVTLLLGDKESLRGKIAGVPEPPRPRPEDAARAGFLVPAPSANLLLLRTTSGTTAIPTSDVRRVTTDAGDFAREVVRKREAASLAFSVDPKGEGPSTLSLLYLVRGLTWVPSYAIDLSEKEKATLTAQAEVIDEAEDLEGATLQFVTGFPNLKFAHVVDPIAMQGDLNAFLAALGQPPDRSIALQAQQGVLSNVAYRGEADAATFPVAGVPLQGESAEDLFLYEQKDVTLQRGERALYALFTVRVPYEHLYEWSIPDTIGENPYQPRPEAPREEEIWHSVRLTNDTGLPWTTAPAMTMKGGNLLGQDTLAYAAVAAKTTVRITRAVDVQGEQAEYEVARDRGAAHFYGSTYDRVTVKGEICATNHKREGVRLEITKQIQGEVTKNPNEAKVVQVAKGLRQVNPNARLTWTVPIDAGKRATIDYEYALYVRP
ncbi:MAG TPA: hypothetical protein VFI25_19970 [Planctomycetota bacterium]|jgi:hypothetical protein|nr:hypothetical protein [Planctomycetota bacterium]